MQKPRLLLCANHFPPPQTLCTPNLFVLNDLLQYMRECAQTHTSTIFKKMNLFYIAIETRTLSPLLLRWRSVPG